jgi:phospholipase C
MEGDRRYGRREFIAGAAGAGLALAAGSPGWAQRPRVAARTLRRGDIERVEHVVIFMQENRSFDHYYGTLPGVRGFSDPRAMKLPNGRSVFEQPYALSPDGFLRPWRFDPATTNPCNSLVNNAWEDRHRAWNNGRMDGHITATAGLPNYFTMAYYTRKDIAWHMAVADAFTVCDAYHCSVIGPTNPNRLYLWTGMIDPRGTGGGPVIDNHAYDDRSVAYTWKTYPERLQKAGVSWRVYHEVDDFGDNDLTYFKQYQQSKPGSPLYENSQRNRPADAFMQDVAADHLPQVSWIVAPTRVSEHQLVSAPGLGADYCAQVFKALALHPKVWRKTALIFNYDEDGGYFDHVAPPTPPAGTRDEFVGGKPIGLGFRVPAVVCSPWTRGGRVCSQTYDHTSVLRFLERRFGVEEPNISEWRRKTCGDLWESFDFADPDYSFPRLPATAGERDRDNRSCRSAPFALPRVTNGPQPKQEPGTKPRRPCTSPARPVLVRLPGTSGRRVSGAIAVSGRKVRRLTARELASGRVVLRDLPAGTTQVVKLKVRVRAAGRVKTLRGERVVRARCR